MPADFDGQPRPIGTAADIGADEFVAADLTATAWRRGGSADAGRAPSARWLGEPGYDANADFNGDNTVDVVDLLMLVDYFGL